MYFFLIRAYLTGFFAACIVGPVFTLILYRTIVYGTRAGLVSAMGMAFADGSFFIFSVLSGIASGKFFIKHVHILEFLGGPLMLFFGFWTLFKRSNSVDIGVTVDKHPYLLFHFLSTMLLTMSNPLTLLFFGTIAGQMFPDLGFFALNKVFLAGFLLSLGSFSLLSCAILGVSFQSSFNLKNMIGFFKIISGVGLILTGVVLIFKSLAARGFFNFI